MADAILTPSASTAPPLDTVLLWLTNTVERDYEARQVFTDLRQQSARSVRSASSLHLLTLVQAARLLDDAKEREAGVRKGLKVAYTAHVKNCETAIQDAQQRTTAFTGASAHCADKSDSYERWWGTKAQLTAQGVCLKGPWPQEPQGKRWAKATDWRGYKASVSPYSPIWPGLYEARVEIPIEVWGKKYDQKSNMDSETRARRDLALMPASADDFRAHLVGTIRMMVRVHLEMAMEPTYHGYSMDEDAVSEIQASFDAIADAVAGARVKFDRARHEEVAQGYRAKIANADTAFQSRIAMLVKPNPRILRGDDQ